jgi:hypothetical protein
MKCKLVVKSSVSTVLLSLAFIRVGFAASGDGGVWAEHRANDRTATGPDEFQSPPSEKRRSLSAAMQTAIF